MLSLLVSVFAVDRRLRNDPPFPVPQPSFLFLQLVQGNVGVFANQHELLFAAIRTEADVVDAFFVVFRFAIDHCVLRLEATLGLVNRLAERASCRRFVMRMYSVAVRFAMRFP